MTSVDGCQAAGSREAILAAAGELFAERGYRPVTIRDIAGRAGVSAALVMKLCGSKKELFYATATIVPVPLPDVPLDRLGETLVRELLDRAAAEEVEPLNRAIVLRLSAPDPDAVRERFITGYLEPLAERLDGSDAHLRAELAVAALAGLATAVRIFQAPLAATQTNDVVRTYGSAVQALLEG